MSKRIFLPLLALLISALACNLPGPAAPSTPTAVGPDVAFTIAAETVQAELTRVALALPATPTAPMASAVSTNTNTPESIATATASATLLVSPTFTPIPCNAVSFVQDVSIPDGTSILSGSGFTKTWRLKNIGSCTWTSSYALVFDRGDKMNGPDAQALTGTVAPGQTVDISANLTAPAEAGNYRGYWRLRDGSGVLFGLSTGSFWVDIKSVAATATPAPAPTSTNPPVLPPPVGQIIAPLVAGESGSVRGGGSVFSFVNVGDVAANVSQQGFVSFDISGLPAGAIIIEVKANFAGYDTLGNPFALGCLRMYPQNYGSVDASDFFSGSASGAVGRWCDSGQLGSTMTMGDLKAHIQSLVGGSRARFRLQFNENATNNDGADNMARLGGGLQLIISFTQ